MARRDDIDDRADDFEARPRRAAGSAVTGTHVILAGVAAGLVAAIVGGGIWLTAKERKPSANPEGEKEVQDFHNAMWKQYAKPDK